jgi:hypothetical protein
MTDETHYPNNSSALLDLHRLLVIFLASEGIAALPQKGSLRQSFGDIERDEITRILLTVAATVRIVEDRTSGGGKIFDLLLDTSCGELIPDLSRQDQREVLDIREACNKILHSLRMEPAKRTLPDGDEVLDASILLHGTKNQGRVNWAAALDVVRFCQASATALELFTDSWRKEQKNDPD